MGHSSIEKFPHEPTPRNALVSQDDVPRYQSERMIWGDLVDEERTVCKRSETDAGMLDEA
jgi:hypothetical protein